MSVERCWHCGAANKGRETCGACGADVVVSDERGQRVSAETFEMICARAEMDEANSEATTMQMIALDARAQLAAKDKEIARQSARADNAERDLARLTVNANQAMDKVERERDEARAERDAAILEMSAYAQARGEAEGKLRTAGLSGILDGWIDRAKVAEACLADVRAALGFRLGPGECCSEHDAGLNLKGALTDLDRLSADKVCRSTIRRVCGQLGEAARLLDRPPAEATEGERDG